MCVRREREREIGALREARQNDPLNGSLDFLCFCRYAGESGCIGFLGLLLIWRDG